MGIEIKEAVTQKMEWLIYEDYTDKKWKYVSLILKEKRTPQYQAKVDYALKGKNQVLYGTREQAQFEIAERNGLNAPKPPFQGKLRFVYKRLAPKLQGWVLEEATMGEKKIGGNAERMVQWLKEKLTTTQGE